MAAGTVLSGGFPGRVAQEVQPNPKCNGCLHFDGQGGRTGICTIGSKPWNCGDGDAADIGFAPITRGAGTYLPNMDNYSARAPDAGTIQTSELHGVGSTRPVQFQQVSLGEEHVHFVKSFISGHTSLQKSMCRLCQSNGMIGMAPANVGPQVCTCSSIAAYDVAKALMQKLGNRERSVIDLDDLTAFIYDVAKAGFKRLEKATFYHEHGKYEVSPAGGGEHHVDFHPRGGGTPTRLATTQSPGSARAVTQTHARRFASGTGADNAGGGKPKSTKTPAGLPSMEGAVSVAKKSLKWFHGSGDNLDARAPHGSYIHQKTKSGHTVSYVPKDAEAPIEHLGYHESTAAAVHKIDTHHAERSVKKALSFKPHPESPRNHVAASPHGEYEISASNKPGKTHRLDFYAHGGGDHPTSTTHHASHGAAVAHANSVVAVAQDGKSLAFDDGDVVEKAIDHSKHSHIVTGKLAPEGRGASSRVSAVRMVDKLDNKYGGYAHSVKPNPDFKPPAAPGAAVEKSIARLTQAVEEVQKAEGMHPPNRYGAAPRPQQAAPKTSGPVTQPSQVSAPKTSGPVTQPSQVSAPKTSGPVTQPSQVDKSLDDLLWDLHEEEDTEKSLRWSHKAPGEAKTSHGKYTVGAHPDGGHTVTYTNKATGKSHAKTFKTHREALGAVTEHHIKNRPPPKPRKKKDPNAPKQLTARAGASPHCPPCS